MCSSAPQFRNGETQKIAQYSESLRVPLYGPGAFRTVLLRRGCDNPTDLYPPSRPNAFEEIILVFRSGASARDHSKVLAPYKEVDFPATMRLLTCLPGHEAVHQLPLAIMQLINEGYSDAGSAFDCHADARDERGYKPKLARPTKRERPTAVTEGVGLWGLNQSDWGQATVNQHVGQDDSIEGFFRTIGAEKRAPGKNQREGTPYAM